MSSSAGRITDIGHAAYACHDLDASLRFYAQLGLHEAFRLNRDDGSPWLVYVHVAGDRFLELFTGGPDPDSERPRGSYMHLCLVVDDLVAVVEDIRAKGITIDREPTQGRDTNLQAWIKDLDGNPIEFMQISPESPQRAASRRGA